jgi:molecular chaperone HscB
VSSSIPEYFSLFGLAPRFAIDTERLTRAYREVLAHVHPDRYVSAGAGERRAAMQMASHANEAFQVLRSDCARAAYLCRTNGVVVDGPGAVAMAPSFLEQQMQWREALDAAHGDARAVDGLAREVAAERARIVHRTATAIDERGDYHGAAVEVRALMFVDKLLSQIELVGGDRAADRIAAPAEPGVRPA